MCFLWQHGFKVLNRIKKHIAKVSFADVTEAS